MRKKSMMQHRSRAQSMLEFALVTPMLFLLILGIIELGYILFVYTEVQNAAREGARTGAVIPCRTSDTAIITATRAKLPVLVDPNDITPLIEPPVSAPDEERDFGKPITVTVTYSFAPLDPLTERFIPQITINAVALRNITTGCSSTFDITPPPPPECDVPNWVASGKKVNAAESEWEEAGFEPAKFTPIGAGNFAIKYQSLAPGVYECDVSITVKNSP